MPLLVFAVFEKKWIGFKILVCRTLPSIHRILGIDVDAALTVVQDGLDVADGGHLVEVIHSMNGVWCPMRMPSE